MFPGMRILIAPDKFKGSLDAGEVAETILDGLTAGGFRGNAILFPMADGGEGTVDILVRHSQGIYRSAVVNDPLFRKITARYGTDKEGKRAYIEMSAASGLTLLKEKERNCLYTTTYGTGELMLDAFRNGCEEIVVCLGGSATNDGGTGMAAALGYRFYDKSGNLVIPTGKNLVRIHDYDDVAIHDLVFENRVRVLCDVAAPLYGKEGAACVYGPQKGAAPPDVRLLDHGLKKLAKLVEQKTGKDYSMIPGAGAAGGLGFGLMAFCRGLLLPGFDMVARLTGFGEELKKCDLVITGEGRYDEQTLQGKTVEGIRQMAIREGKPMLVIAGTASSALKSKPPRGILQVITLYDHSPGTEEILRDSKDLLRQASQKLAGFLNENIKTTR